MPPSFTRRALLSATLGTAAFSALPEFAYAAAGSAPAPASQVGYSELLFSDDFDSLASIDTSRSGAAGFNWYLNRLKGWPAMSVEELGIADSVLTINQQTSNVNVGISSMCSATGNGQSFKRAYFEARIRFDPSLQGQRDGSPSFFSVSADAFNGLERDRWAELDFYETIPGAYNGSVHDWRLANGEKQDQLNVRSNYALVPGVDYSQWNTVGCLWTAGCVRYYLNQNLILTTHYSKDSVPPENPQLPVGTFSILDDETNGLVLILGSGANYPMDVDWVRVWGEPDLANVLVVNSHSPEPALPYNAQFTYSDTSGFFGQNGASVSLDSANPQSGSKCLRIDNSAASTSSASVLITQGLDTSREIFAAFWHRGDDSANLRAIMHFIDDDNNYLGNFSGSTVVVAADWHEYRFQGIVPSGSTKVFFALDRPGQSGIATSIWIDMVNVWQNK